MSTLKKKAEDDIDVAAEVASQETMTEDFPPGDDADGGELVAQGQGNLPAEQDGFHQEDDPNLVEPLVLAIKKDTGILVCDKEEAEYEYMVVSLSRMHDACELFPANYEKDNPALCCSNDGLNPSCDKPMYEGDAPNPCKAVKILVNGKYETRKPCEYGNWNGKTKPRCQEVKRMLVHEVGEGTLMPYWFSVKSLGAPILRAFMKQLNRKVQSQMIPRMRAGLSESHQSMFSFKISTFLHEGKKGDSYQPVFSDIRKAEDDIEEMLVSASDACSDVFYIRTINYEDIDKWKAEHPLG